MDKQITRNAEEQEAFEALMEGVTGSMVWYGVPDYDVEAATEKLERRLLASGWMLVKIPPINPIVVMPREVCNDQTSHFPHGNCDGNQGPRITWDTRNTE